SRVGHPALMDIGMDLSLRVEWLEQALAAVPDEGALARLRGLVKSLDEIERAAGLVETYNAQLEEFLTRLYAWCDGIASDLERMATSLRQGRPTSIVFSHDAVSRSYARFAELMDPIQRNAHGDL